MKPKTILVGIVIGLIVGSIFGYLISNTQLNQLHKEVTVLQQKNSELENKVSQLENNVSLLVGTLSIRDSELSNLSAELNELEAKLVEKDIEISSLKSRSGHPLNNQVINIGVISPTNVSLSSLRLVFDQASRDINAYCRKLGYNVSFNFLLESAESSANTHLTRVQGFKARGINLLIGGDWDNQAQQSLQYVNENNMLMLSPSSSDNLLSIPNDNLYRLSPDKNARMRAFSSLMWGMGIKAVIVFQSENISSEQEYLRLEEEYTKMGGEIVEVILHSPDVTEFSTYLSRANASASQIIEEYGGEHVGIAIIGQTAGQVCTITTQVYAFYSLRNLPWFIFYDEASFKFNELFFWGRDIPECIKIYGSSPINFSEDVFSPVDNRFRNWYDAAWIYAKAILEASTTDVNTIKKILPDIAKNYYGASGLCELNSAGDRGIYFEFWRLAHDYMTAYLEIIGVYDEATGRVNWRLS